MNSGHGMPNGTLCGKAVVGMLLADDAGDDAGRLQREMIANGDLPKGYFLTEDRMTQARRLPAVMLQEGGGGAWNRNSGFGKKSWAAKVRPTEKSANDN